jgi:hypothetical protein
VKTTRLRHTEQPRTAHGRLARTLIVGVLVAGACRGPLSAFVPRDTALPKANDLFGALALRFGVADRDPRFAAIRPRLIRHALTPSSIYADSTIWTSASGGVMTVAVAGGVVANRYVLAARDSIPRPGQPGDSRHLMHLRRLDDDVHQWDSTDELALGSIRAEEVAALIELALRASERPGDELRADYHEHLRLTAASLSRLFSLDSLATAPGRGGATDVSFTTRLHPDRLRPFAPLFADYLEEYLEPLRFELVLLDPRDSVVAIARYGRNVLSVRYASENGALRPLAVQNPVDTAGLGALPVRADSTGHRLRIAFFAKVLFFEVGTTRLFADVRQLRDRGELGWSLRFRREPRWHFPLAVNRLVRGPLRRPFDADGALLEFVVRDSAGAQTTVERNIHIVVQESAIVRWIGALGATAMDDLSLIAEQEKDRFIGGVLRALGEDVRMMLTGSPGP